MPQGRRRRAAGSPAAYRTNGAPHREGVFHFWWCSGCVPAVPVCLRADGDDDGVMSVGVTVLYFGGCPSWQTAIERVHAAAARAGVAVQVSTEAVESSGEA